MKYETTICVIDPDTYKVKREDLILEVPPSTRSEDLNYELICSFFKVWNKQDKYSKVYSIGVDSYKLIQ